MSVWTNTAEGGTADAAVTIGNSGGASGNAWTAVDNTIYYKSDVSLIGGLCYGFDNPGTAQRTARWHTGVTGKLGAFGMAYYYSSTPANALDIAEFWNGADSTAITRVRISTSNELQLVNGANTVTWTSTGTLTPGTVYWISCTINPNTSTSNGTARLAYQALPGTGWAEDSTTLTGHYGGNVNLGHLRVGKRNTTAYSGNVRFDHVVLKTDGDAGLIDPVVWAGAGAAAATSSAVGDLSARLVAAGAVAAVGAALGAATIVPGATTYQAAGTVDAAVVAVGEVTGTLAATGTAPATSAATGAPVAVASPTGSVAASAMVSGEVTSTLPTTGTVAASSATVGAVTVTLSAAGNVVAVSGLTGDTVGPTVHPATGTTTATTSAAGTVTARKVASGSATAMSTASGSVTGVGAASGSVPAGSATLGAVTYTIAAAGSAASAASVTGAVAAYLAVAAAVDAASDTAGAVASIAPVEGVVVVVSDSAGAASESGGYRDITVTAVILPSRYAASGIPSRYTTSGTTLTRWKATL